MKIVCTVLMLLFVFNISLAEESPEHFLHKGSRLVGGGISFSSAGNTYYENLSGDRTQEWIVRPGGGFFMADNLAFALHMEGRWLIQGDAWSSHYSIGPVMQYYFDVVGEDDPKGHAIPYLGLGYLWGQAREDGLDFESKFNSGMWSMSAGISWMISNVVATDLELNYQVGEFTEKVPLDGLARDADRISFFLGVKAFLP